MSHSDSHPWLWMTVGRLVLVKSTRMPWRLEWMLRLEKFSENALWASSSWNWRERGAESKDEEAPEWRRFRAGVDLRLGAIDTSNVNRKRGKERETIRKVPSSFKYQEYWKEVRMHGKCMNMWHAKENASWAQPNPNLSAHKHIAHIWMHDNIIIMLMWCNAWGFKHI